MAKTHAAINKHDRHRTIEETDTVDKGGDPKIMTTMAPTAK
jgi:hypothetical protein